MWSRLLLGFALLGAIPCSACSDDAPPPAAVRVHDNGPSDDDAGTPTADAAISVIREPAPIPNVPKALEDQKCAVETDKVFRLTGEDRPPEDTVIAADRALSRFAVAYIGPSDTCIDAVYLAHLEGGSELGAPETTTALDVCSRILHVALAHNGSAWLIGSVDTRATPLDLWVQTYSENGQAGVTHRISNSPGEESDVALAVGFDGNAMAVWTERDEQSGVAKLLVRALAKDGTPTHDIVSLEEASGAKFGSVSLHPVGSVMALGYRRSDDTSSRIVLEALDPSTGERIRDGWVLSPQAASTGTVDVAGDETQGGVVYSVVDGGSAQLWFQTLGANGKAAMANGGAIPEDPTRIVSPPDRALHASLTKIPPGYVLAYRALPGGVVTTTQIRVLFIDDSGRDGGSSGLALASDFGARTGVTTGYDGRVVVAWSDTDAMGKSTLNAVRVPCIAERN